MIKSCVITTVHQAFDVRIFYKESKTLAGAGFDVTLIAPYDKHECIEDINIIPLSAPKNRISRIFSSNFQAYRLAVNQNADIYHFHDPEFIPWALLLSLFTKAKVVYDIHENYHLQIKQKTWIPFLFRQPFSLIFDLFEKTACLYFDMLICATEGIADRFNNYRCEVIHNYVSPELIPRKKKTIQEKERLTVIYHGAISESRGVLQILKSVSYLSFPERIKLLFIGELQPAKLKNEIESLPGYKDTHFYPRMNPTKVYDHLLNADIGLVCLHPLPRYKSSLPVKLFEYMATGLPVVASNFPFWRNIIEKNNCGIMVDPMNPEEIAEAIDYLIANPNIRRKMGENGMQAAYNLYNWETEGKKLIEIYLDLFNSKGLIK